MQKMLKHLYGNNTKTDIVKKSRHTKCFLEEVNPDRYEKFSLKPVIE